MIRDVRRDGHINRIRYWLLTSGEPVWSQLNRIEPIHSRINKLLVNNAIAMTRTRPHPFSTASSYSSLDSLRDKTFFARHLPEASARPVLPSAADAAQLFLRHGAYKPSSKSTMLFAAFAQWFTDGFLLTDLPANVHRTHSSHDIDLAQLYGLTSEITRQLRVSSNDPGRRGRLKTQVLHGEEYPPFLYGRDGRNPEFSALPEPAFLQHQAAAARGEARDQSQAKLESLFAFGGERSNSTPQTAMINVLMLREHNRLCGELEDEHPRWDDERVFQTARNILVVILMRIVIGEYINHISPYHHDFQLDPRAAWRAPWNRPGWFTVEFNLLYRWHSLIPDTIRWGQRLYPTHDWLLDNRPLLERGLAEGFQSSSLQRAGEIRLGNTPAALLGTELRAIEQGRRNKLASYNDYRQAMCYPRVERFEQISSDPEVIDGLCRSYRHVDNIEFYVGLFAEDPRENAAVPSLLGRMVALDAFSQALVNPLLSEHVYNDATFSRLGLERIAETSSLADLVKRNVAGGAELTITMTQRAGLVEPRIPLAVAAE